MAKAYTQYRNLGRGCGGDNAPGSTEILFAFRRARARRDHHVGKFAPMDALG